jgi:nucleoside-diphosphate-sugar epimerase
MTLDDLAYQVTEPLGADGIELHRVLATGEARSVREFVEAAFAHIGRGTPRREFLHVDDCADALVFLLRHYSDASTINVGVGRDVTIAELASVVAGVVEFKGEIGFDTSRPDGTPRKLLDVSRLTTLGWQAHTRLKAGIASTYQWLERELTQRQTPRGFPETAERPP